MRGFECVSRSSGVIKYRSTLTNSPSSKFIIFNMLHLLIFTLSFPAMDRFLEMGNDVGEIMRQFNVSDLRELEDRF